LRSILKTALVLSLVFSASMVRAQQVDAYLGAGTARASSAGHSINTFGDGTLYNTPAMGGVFTDFGLNLFLNHQLGVGWTVSWRTAHDYAGLQYRPSFNTFDAVFQPEKLRIKRSAPEFRGGIGLASVHFDFPDQPSCDQVPGCPSSHHFLAHVGAATRLYVTDHIFLRPAVDVNYVNNFFEFGSNWVPRYSLSIGYSFGRSDQ
jgi:hypothetical protein